MIGATIQSDAAFEWLTTYHNFLEAAARFYEGMDGVPYDPDPASSAIASDALWKAVIQGIEGSPEAIREIARMTGRRATGPAERYNGMSLTEFGRSWLAE